MCRVGRVSVQLLGGQGARACVILVLSECIWNAPAVLPTFDDTGSLGSHPRRVVYPPGSILGDASRFLAGIREA